MIRHIERFTVTDEHLRLLRRTHVSWDSAEFGAPGLDPKLPYGNSNVFGDIAEILEVPDREWMDVDDELNADAEWAVPAGARRDGDGAPGRARHRRIPGRPARARERLQRLEATRVLIGQAGCPLFNRPHCAVDHLRDWEKGSRPEMRVRAARGGHSASPSAQRSDPAGRSSTIWPSWRRMWRSAAVASSGS